MKRARKKNNKQENTQAVIHNRPEKKKKIRTSTIWKIVIAVILVLIAAVFIALGFGVVNEEELLAPVDRESGRINVLLLGVDDDGLRTDSVMVASLDLETANVNIMSIPRDTKLYVKNKEMTRKMTEIHAMGTGKGNGIIAGPIGSAEAVTQLTGIPINYYVEFSFDSIRSIFDALGTITYDVPDVEGGGKGMNYEDSAQDLYIHLKPGVQELDGDKILQLMRYRKGDSDFARMERQQNVIKAVVEQKLNASLLLKLPKIFSKMKKEINTNISISDVTKYAGYLTDVSVDKIQTYQLPGKSERQKAGWYFICDIEAAKTMIAEAFECDTSEISTTIEINAENSSAKAVKNIKKQTGTPQKSTKKTASSTPTPSPTAKPKATAKPKVTATAKPEIDNTETEKKDSKPTGNNTAKSDEDSVAENTKNEKSEGNNGEINESDVEVKKAEPIEDNLENESSDTGESITTEPKRDPEPTVMLIE